MLRQMRTLVGDVINQFAQFLPACLNIYERLVRICNETGRNGHNVTTMRLFYSIEVSTSSSRFVSQFLSLPSSLSPWYNRNGLLGVKHQLLPYPVPSPSPRRRSFHRSAPPPSSPSHERAVGPHRYFCLRRQPGDKQVSVTKLASMAKKETVSSWLARV